MDLSGFTKKKVGYGQWIITYQKPNQRNSFYRWYMTDAPLYDAIFNTQEPKQSDIKHLRYCVLTYGEKIAIN